jgi:hypothetical protein
MSAGSGIRHSEFNASTTEPCHLLQIWIEPKVEGIVPSYSQKPFPVLDQPNKLILLASEDGAEGSLILTAEAELRAAKLTAGTAIDYAPKLAHGWIQVANGSMTVNGYAVEQGDGLAVSDEAQLTFVAGKDGAEFLLFDLA